MKDYYYILGLTKTSTETQIKSAYRKLSIKFHPDKNDGDKFFEERFKDIQEAYDTLSDTGKRATYDFKLQNTQPSTNTDSLKKYEEQLKKKYDEELRRKEDEIKRKYQTPEQRQAEENEIGRRQAEAKIRKQKEDTLKAIEENKSLLSKREVERTQLETRIKVLNPEIANIKKTIERLYETLHGQNNIDDAVMEKYEKIQEQIEKSMAPFSIMFNKKLVKLLNDFCVNEKQAIKLLDDYEKLFERDLISTIIGFGTSYGIKSYLEPLISKGIIEAKYPHNRIK